MRGKLVVIVVLRRRRLAGGDNIPARPATAQAVDARQQAREDERRVERRRGRADHADMLRRLGEEREQRHSLRSEEHTSELQSLMRISYAVFCLKKKKHTTLSNNSYST